MPAPNVTLKKYLQRGRKRNSKKRSDDSADDQAPDKNRYDHGHRMQSDVVSNNPWRIEKAFQILYDDENHRHDDWMHPIAPLERRDENSRHPANNDADVRNHCEHHHHCTDHGSKVQSEYCERRANENP